jgi:hypothetical protein
MTFAEVVAANIGKHDIKERIALRWLARRCRRDADFSAAFEEEVAERMGVHISAIDWSQIDWMEVAKIVLMLLAAFGVL